MTRARFVVPLLGFVLALAVPLAAQEVAGFHGAARGGVVFESYLLGKGLAFDRIAELTIPVSVVQRIGSRLTIDIGTAYARAQVRQSNDSTIEHSGFVDTDVRAAFVVVPGRMIVTVVGTLPTGAATVPDTTIPLFGATATHLLGFTTPGFGAGGAVTVGFASAFKVGERWAAGTGASYRYAASYVPVTGGGELSPGAEGRVRFGIEGPFGGGGGKYFRAAAVYTASEHDDLTGGQMSIAGDRVLVYAAVSLPLGRSSLSLWGWDMRRFRPRGATTTYGNAVKTPRGNVLALGARLERPVSPSVTLAPHLELRHELSGFERLELLGYLVRGGTDLRLRVGDQAALVVQGSLAVGKLQDQGASVSLIGPRAGVLLEWRR